MLAGQKGVVMKKLSLVSLLVLAVSANGAWAGGVSVDQSRVLDRWTFRVGGFLTGLSTDIRVDNPITGQPGTEISLEDDLGFSSSESVPRLRLSFILGKRHQFSAGWYNTSRDSTTTISEEIRWEDNVFPINADLAASYDTEFFDVAYTYYFYSSETTALGVTGGLVYAQLSAGLGLNLLGQGIQRQDEVSTDVPVPQVGFTVYHDLGHRFVIVGSALYISFNISDWEGSASGAFAGLEYRAWKNFGFGAGYNYSNYDVDANSDSFLGTFTYTLGGFELYGRLAW